MRVLEGLGFNAQLLGNKTYVVSRLQTLTEKDVLRIREVFAKCRHTRFMKSFSYHLPFGTKDAYVKEIMVADRGKLASLIRICGFLMETKAAFLVGPDFNWLRRMAECLLAFLVGLCSVDAGGFILGLRSFPMRADNTSKCCCRLHLVRLLLLCFPLLD